MNDANRYHSKRDAGISPIRSDGSVCSVETDVNAAGAEQFGAEALGCRYDAEIYLRGDAGYDFILPLEVEVVWLGLIKHTKKPRRTGHLIVNPYEPKRWADIYLVVSGSLEMGYELVGWTTHTQLARQQLKDFGYGEKMAMHTSKLWPIDRLKAVKRDMV